MKTTIINLGKLAVRFLPYGQLWDKLYCSILFAYSQGRIPKKNSGLFNDYLFFLKVSGSLYDILRQLTSDKRLVKDFVSQTIGDTYVVPTISVFSSVEEILNSSLPAPCILKPSHSSGNVVFIKDGHHGLDAADVERLKSALGSSPYQTAREGNYRYLRKQILCEDLLPEAESIKDYKFFCYRGEPKLIQVDSERHTSHKRNLYDVKWMPLKIIYNFPIGDWEDAPSQLPTMLMLSRKLARHFESVRVDFFISGERLFVGELTHCPESAHGVFGNIESEKLFSEIYFNA